MRIGLIVPGFSADESDWCIPALLDFARALSRQAELEIFTLRYPHRRGTYTVGGALVHSLGWAQRRGVHSARLWWSAMGAILARHRRAPFDCLHAVWADEPSWIGAACAPRLGLPLVVSLFGGELSDLRGIGYGLQRYPLQRRLIDWTLRRATVIAAGSRYMLELARPHVPDPRRLQLAPFGVDSERYSPLDGSLSRSIPQHAPPATPSNSGRSDDAAALKQSRAAGIFAAPNLAPGDGRADAQMLPGDSSNDEWLINVGSLTAVKGHAHLLRTMRHIAAARPQARLCIAGDGPLRPVLQRQIDALGLAAHVTLAGALAHERMPELYRGAVLFVQASLHEAEGMALLEAAACGVPALGTGVGVLPELAARGAAQVAPGDERALADAMLALLSEPARRQAMARAARAAAVADYSVAACVTRFMALYVSCYTE